MNKRIFSAVLAAAALAGSLSLTSCGRDKNAETVSLRIWGAQDDQNMLREMCDSFAKAHPDKQYEFTFGVVGEGTAKQMILDDPDAAADVFHFANDQIGDLVAAGALAQIGGSYRDAVTAENGEGSVEASMVEDVLQQIQTPDDRIHIVFFCSTFDERFDGCSVLRPIELAAV